MAASIEIAISQAVKEQVDKVLENPEFKTEIHQMFAEKCDPYVPYITGALAGNISVGSDGITYKQPYAEYVYDSANVHNTTYHPLASSRWDEVAVANHRDEIGQEVVEAIERWIKTKR